MKIWVDARKASQENEIGSFIRYFIEKSAKSKNDYVFFIDEYFKIEIHSDNISYLRTNLKNSIREEFKMWNLLKSRNFDNTIFFDASVPVNYNKPHSVFPWIFDRIIYKQWIWRRYKFLIKYKIKRANEIICFTENQKEELIEAINIDSNKIKVVYPWFRKEKLHSWEEIKWKYFICENNGDPDLIMNLIRAMDDFKTTKLVILWKDNFINRRIKTFLSHKRYNTKVVFMDKNSKEIYKKALWYVHCSLSDLFPFSLNKAIENNLKVITPKSNNTKEILWDSAFYYSSLSIGSIKTILESIKKQEKIEYKDKILESHLEKII